MVRVRVSGMGIAPGNISIILVPRNSGVADGAEGITLTLTLRLLLTLILTLSSSNPNPTPTQMELKAQTSALHTDQCRSAYVGQVQQYVQYGHCLLAVYKYVFLPVISQGSTWSHYAFVGLRGPFDAMLDDARMGWGVRRCMVVAQTPA